MTTTPRTDPTTDAVPDAEPVAPAIPVLREPADGVPPVIDTPTALDAAAAALAAGHGPVAVDAERASGYRYGQRAYLVQIRRDGAGTFLIDPIAFADLSVLHEVIGDAEWVLHAASQDLPCLAEVGLAPAALFDTELAGRLLGLPRVGLAALTETLLGVALAKEHSAVDWSTRPLPQPWLAYAALDVELLLPLHDLLRAQLIEAGKDGWAAEEFARVVAAPPPAPRTDPWRRTSGLHKVRGRRQLAVVRELWTAREELARTRDTAPGRLLPDSAIVAAAVALPAAGADLPGVAGFNGRAARSDRARWVDAVDRALALPEADLPGVSAGGDTLPPPRTWGARNPAAAARLAAARDGMQRLAEQHAIPLENLLTPELLRRLCWEPPDPADAADVRHALAAAGARTWQIDVALPTLLDALAAVPG